MNNHSTFITTQNFIFRKLDISDSQSILALLSDKNVIKYNDGKMLSSLKEAENLIKNINTHPKDFRLAVIRKKDHEFIGFGGFRNWDRASSKAEIGGVLSQKNWGKGYTYELLDGLVSFGFKNLNLRRIYAKVRPANKVAIHITEKYGFKRERRLQRAYYKKGKFYDLLLYSLSKDDYKA